MVRRYLAPTGLTVAWLLASCAPVDPADGAASTAEASTSTSAALDGPGDPCAGLTRRPGVSVVAHPPLVEISGAVVSRRSPGAVWVHEDSGNEPVLAELGLEGTLRSRWVVSGAQNVDWEDIAAAVDAEGVRHLFVGDVGDNRRVRPHLEVLRLPEPLGEPSGTTLRPDTLRLVMPESPADVEALIVDPATADLIVVTKEPGGAGQVLVAAGAAWSPDGATISLVERGTLRLGPGHPVLAGDLSPDGTLVALRTPFRVLLWRHEPGTSLAVTLLSTEPCRAPAVFDPFGEALAFLDDGYVLVGEGETAELVTVHLLDRAAGAARDAPRPKPPARRSPTTPRRSRPRRFQRPGTVNDAHPERTP